MPQKIIPHLWFDKEAQQATDFYVSLFKNSKVINTSHYGKAGSKVSGMPEGSVMNIEFELGEQKFVALNGGPVFEYTPATSFFVGCESSEEVDRLFAALCENGTILMPLNKYPFSERYAWVNDRYGVSWQLFLGNRPQKISPCFMFVQKNYGKAQEAINFYLSIFRNSGTELIVPYEQGENEAEGTIKHGAFFLEGEHFIAMDSGLEHNFTFTPAVSFLVECKDQAEIDYYWEKLSAVPEAEQCGWIMDKYGVSWQIVPEILDSLVINGNTKKAENMMSVLFDMKKLDISALKEAFDKG